MSPIRAIGHAKFKKTKIGEIPEEWELRQIREVCSTFAGGTPSRSNGRFFGGTIPWVKSAEVTQGLVFVTEETITEEGLANSSAKWVPSGSTLVAMYGATAGEVGLLKIRATTNQAVVALIPNSSAIDSTYLYQCMLGQKRRLARLTQGSGQPNLSQNIVRELLIPIPPREEQERIGEILSTVDKLLKNTCDIVSCSEEIKNGLMQHLLTRGIGHTKFKKTKIGEIPESWEIRALGELSKINARSLNDKTDSESEIEYIEIASIEDPGYIGHTSRMRYSEAPSRARRIVRKGDVIVSTVRPYLKAIALIRQDSDDLVASTGFAVLTPLKNLDSEFLLQSVFSEYFMAYLTRRMVGSNYPAVTAKDIEQYQLACPPEKEQRRIASILRIVDEKMETERKYCIELECLKKGLMQVLLTGKVRVKV